MYEIGIVAKKSHELIRLQSVIGRDFELQCRAFLRVESVMRGLEGQDLNAFVFALPVFNLPQLKIIQSMRVLYPSLPLLVMSSLVAPTARRHFQFINGKTYLKEQTNIDDIPGIIKKMIRGDQVCLRSHQRYVAQKSISIKGPNSRFTGRIQNIGVGGFQASIHNSALEAGEMINVEIPNNTLSGSHHLKGEVAWVAPRFDSIHSNDRQTAVGIRFLA